MKRKKSQSRSIMARNRELVRISTASGILDNTLAIILGQESPLDARISTNAAPSFTIAVDETNFPLHKLADLLFCMLVEYGNDYLELAEICGLSVDNNGPLYFRYVQMASSLENTHEIEFIARVSNNDHRIRRFKILAALDALISIATCISIMDIGKNMKTSDVSGLLFRESFYLFRNLSLLYHIDKLKKAPQFCRRDGVEDSRFSQPPAGKKEQKINISLSQLAVADREKFESMIRDALCRQEQELNDRNYKIIATLFENIKQDRLKLASKGGREKGYILTLADVIFKFISEIPCDNKEQFKRRFGELYSEKNPYEADDKKKRVLTMER